MPLSFPRSRRATGQPTGHEPNSGSALHVLFSGELHARRLTRASQLLLPRNEEATLPRIYGQRDYQLPDSVQTNISRQHYYGAPGMWDYACGLLIETCLVLPWTPLTLVVGVEPLNDEETSAVVLTIIAQDENRDIVTVVWRQDHGIGAQEQDVWQLTTNGAVHHHRGATHVRPSPPILATIIRDAING